MIGVHQQQGVVPHVVLVHEVQHPSQRPVAHRDERLVLVAGVLDLVLGLRDLRVGRPVELGALVAMRVEPAVLLVREERLVRVEALDLQEPLVRVRVRGEEFQPGVERAGLRMLGLAREVSAVDGVLPMQAILEAGQRSRRRDVGLPRVALLTAEELPGRVPRVVRRAAVLPVVRVVAREVRVHAGLAEHLRHRVVPGLERAPGAVQEVVPSGVQFSTGGHARHGSGVEPVEGHGPLGETAEVRGVDLVRAVRRQQMPVQAVEHDHDRAHQRVAPLSDASAAPGRSEAALVDAAGFEAAGADPITPSSRSRRSSRSMSM